MVVKSRKNKNKKIKIGTNQEGTKPVTTEEKKQKNRRFFWLYGLRLVSKPWITLYPNRMVSIGAD